MLSVAKLRLADLEKNERGFAETRKTADKGRMTFGDGLAIFKTQTEATRLLKPAGKRYHAEVINSISKSWPDLESLDRRRISESANITWADYDFEKQEIIVRGDPETGTKNWSIRRVPMISDMMELLQHLRAKRPDDKPDNTVMPIRECQKAMDRAARIVGMKRITHHDLRHHSELGISVKHSCVTSGRFSRCGRMIWLPRCGSIWRKIIPIKTWTSWQNPLIFGSVVSSHGGK